MAARRLKDLDPRSDDPEHYHFVASSLEEAIWKAYESGAWEKK